MNISSDICYKKAFYVINDQSPNATPKLALEPKLFIATSGEQKIAWDDNANGRQFTCKKITILNKFRIKI